MADIRVDRTRLEAMMKRRGFNNVTLAREWGKHYNAITRLKREESTSLKALAEICDILRCSPIDLLVWEGLPDPDPNSGAPASR